MFALQKGQLHVGSHVSKIEKEQVVAFEKRAMPRSRFVPAVCLSSASSAGQQRALKCFNVLVSNKRAYTHARLLLLQFCVYACANQHLCSLASLPVRAGSQELKSCHAGRSHSAE